MKGVTILDRDATSGTLSFDLWDILSLLGADVERSMWTARDVDCIGGEAADALQQASVAGDMLIGARLMELARNVTQVVDGEFSGRLPGHGTDWIMIRVVDSSAFDILTEREDVLRALKTRFDRVEDLPM